MFGGFKVHNNLRHLDLASQREKVRWFDQFSGNFTIVAEKRPVGDVIIRFDSSLCGRLVFDRNYDVNHYPLRTF